VEGETQTYTLEDTMAEVFDLFLHWLYTKSIKSNIREYTAQFAQRLETQKRFDEEILKLVQLWVLTDNLLIPRLQNLTFDEIFAGWDYRDGERAQTMSS
jgi:hypothetical protein